MNKNAIKKFAIEARKKLIASVSDKAGMLGITEDDFQKNPITRGTDFAIYRTATGTEITLNMQQCHQRELLVQQLESHGYEAVIEEVAYTWFNRICAIRFMEVNDYLPTRVRVLSSEKAGKNEPDLVTQAPDVHLDFADNEREWIIEAKMNNKLDDLFKMLFIKQCNKLHKILPELFEETEDYTEILLNLSYTNEDDVVYMLVNSDGGIPEADFNVSAVDENGVVTGQVEIIGWLYQYYNTELKDDTFAKLKKNIKITKERIPAATQLFTPDWIVRYMVENSVGRVWIEHLRALDSTVNEKATAEHFGWKYYLPEAEQEESVNLELAEIRKDYKDLQPTDIKCIDPCMGSGHILIAMFDVLMDIYKSVGYSERDAAFDIVENNIHGLDIDQRAYQLAYFAVMMKGRGYNRRFFCGRDDVKPVPRVYAIMESNNIPRNHLQFFGSSLGESERNTVSEQVEYLLHTFVDAREYGSILNVDECDWEALERFVSDLSLEEQYSLESVGSEETQEKLRRLVQIAKLFGQKYDAVVTNPPYMGASNMNATLSNFIKDNYADYKSDFFSAFIVRCSNMAKTRGYLGFLTPYVWMFIQSYEKLRRYLYTKATIEKLIQFEYSAFEEATVPICTFVIANSYVNKKGCYLRLTDFRGGMEVQRQKTLEATENHKCGFYYEQSADDFSKISGCPVAYWVRNFAMFNFDNLSFTLQSGGRVKTHNNDLYVRNWWEVKLGEERWVPFSNGGEYRKWYGDHFDLVDWSTDARSFYAEHSGLCKENFWFKEGLTWGAITSGYNSYRIKPENFMFSSAAPTVFSADFHCDLSVLSFLNTKVAKYLSKVINPTLNQNVNDTLRLPYSGWNSTAADKAGECITLSKCDWDSFETSWDFKRHPLVAFAKKTTYKMNGIPSYRVEDAFFWWENGCNIRFAQLKANEEELNRIFIDIYGLQEELTPDVEDKDVTVRKADLGRDIRSFISYAVGCMFGRYSIYKDGICYAGGEWNRNDFGFYASQYFDDGTYPKELYQSEWFMPDDDNIIPITDEEYFPDDIVNRFVEFVKTVYGEDTLEENLDFIANALNVRGTTSREVIRNYFLKDFYADHLKVYQKRPIYWLFDSGKQNGFKALIYMHRYDADTVGRVRTDYLHQAQNYVETAMKSAQYTIDNSASASEKSKATKAVTKYTKQLAEMQSYDEAIAHIANQRIEIDLDDGVKVNYAKFQGVEVAQEGKKAIKVNLLAKI